MPRILGFQSSWYFIISEFANRNGGSANYPKNFVENLTNRKTMDTFVEIRKYMANTSLLYNRLNAMEARQINYQTETDERFERVFAYISQFPDSIED